MTPTPTCSHKPLRRKVGFCIKGSKISIDKILKLYAGFDCAPGVAWKLRRLLHQHRIWRVLCIVHVIVIDWSFARMEVIVMMMMMWWSFTRMEVMTKDLLAMACKVPPSSASFSTLSSEEIKRKLFHRIKKSFILQKLFHKLTIVILWLMRAAAEKCEANADRLLLSCSQASSKYNCSEAVIFSSKSKWCLTLAPSTWNIHILIKSVEPPWGNLRLSNLSRNP